MVFKRVNSADEPIMKSRDDRLSELKWSIIRTLVYLSFFMFYDIVFMHSHFDSVTFIWVIRIMYSLGFVLSLHSSRTVYWVYKLENELREHGIYTDEDLRRSHQEVPNDTHT